MSTIKDFEQLKIWMLAREIVRIVYSNFRDCKDYVFKNQITGAGISSMNNISEGFCRNSDAEFRQFLNISKGSAGEIKNMYYIAEDFHYVLTNTASDRRQKCQNLIHGISSIMKYLKPSKTTRL